MARRNTANPRLTSLDGLFAQLSSSCGLYSKATFLNLYGCIARIVRDQPEFQGFVLTRTLGDDAFETLALSLADRSKVPLTRLEPDDPRFVGTGISPTTGFLIVVTNRFCAALHWSSATDATYHLFEGGWTFHPGDTRTIASQLLGHLQDVEGLALLEATEVDRRYDDKLNLLIGPLVSGLESRNRELGAALAQVEALNQKVVDSERLAAVGQLCSVIAHEIRNPLGLIDLYAKLVETQLQKIPLPQGADGEQLTKNLSMIRQATTNLDTILSELTQYSRPLQLSCEPTDLVQLVGDVCEFLQPSFDDKTVGLSLAPDTPTLPRLALDAGKIRQALINLLKNALEASAENTAVSVTIASRRGDDWVYVKVSDQGKGIDPAVAPKLFTPYFSTKGNGTGLGLAHSRKILQAHGGTVQLLSTSPQGTVFALVLPKQPPASGESHV